MNKKNAVMTVCVLCVLIPSVLLAERAGTYLKENRNLDRIAEITSEYVIKDAEGTDVQEVSLNPEDFIDIAGMRQENPDTVGYLRIDGTVIDYPVMRSEEKDRYLKKDFFGNRSVYGCIYMDNACYAGGANTVLYGHNMRSGKMFGTLRRYADEEYRNEHKTIKFITENAVNLYEVCAVLSVSANDAGFTRSMVPYSEGEFMTFKEFVDENGTVYEPFRWGDSLLTLCTCEYTHKNGRMLVIAKKTAEVDF